MRGGAVEGGEAAAEVFRTPEYRLPDSRGPALGPGGRFPARRGRLRARLSGFPPALRIVTPHRVRR